MLNRHLRALKRGVNSEVDHEDQGNLAAEVTVGSVTIRVYYSPTRVRIPNTDSAADSAGTSPAVLAFKAYDSYIIPYYEGSLRKTPRRSTLEAAKKLAKETAERLSKDGGKAEILSERDRRIYLLAKDSCQSIGLEVDAACRKLVELQKRLQSGTVEGAVDFYNDHGQRVRRGVAVADIYQEYYDHLEKRGAGEYHLRDTERYAGGFVRARPGPIGCVQTPEIDVYLAGLGGRARSKNNHRDGIIALFNFATQKGYLPAGITHAAAQTTEFRDARQKITSENQARELLEPNDIYLPAQMAKILAAASKYEPQALPSLEIKAFSGVRTEEMVRLWWVMVCEPEELIRIPDAVGKIDARRVPVLQNLKRRLAAHATEVKHERVARKWNTANSLYHAWERVCRRAKVPYLRNGFRNSYFSYRLAILGDLNLVAQEGGTSTGELEKNYLSRAPISRAMAEEWFSL